MSGMWDSQSRFHQYGVARPHPTGHTLLPIFAVRDTHTRLMVSLDSTGEMGGKGVDLTQPVDDGSAGPEDRPSTSALKLGAR